MLRLCTKTYCCCDSLRNKFKLSSNGLNGRTNEDNGDSSMAEYRVLDETENVFLPISMKQPLCDNIRADKEKTLMFLSETIVRGKEHLLFYCKFNFYKYEVIVQISILYVTFSNFYSTSSQSIKWYNNTRAPNKTSELVMKDLHA